MQGEPPGPQRTSPLYAWKAEVTKKLAPVALSAFFTVFCGVAAAGRMGWGWEEGGRGGGWVGGRWGGWV